MDNKEKALQALLTSSTLTEAAEQAGVSRRTLYHYIHKDKNFARKYREMVTAQRVLTLDFIREKQESAFNFCENLMNDEEASEKTRLAAAKILIEGASKSDSLLSTIAEKDVDRTSELWSDFDL